MLQKELGQHRAPQSGPKLGSSADEGLLDPVLEKRFILGETDGRRPGDVSMALWQNSMGLAVDGCLPFSKTNLTAEEPAEKYEVRKHTSYDAGFKGTDWRFCALIFETTGGITSKKNRP